MYAITFCCKHMLAVIYTVFVPLDSEVFAIIKGRISIGCTLYITLKDNGKRMWDELCAPRYRLYFCPCPIIPRILSFIALVFHKSKTFEFMSRLSYFFFSREFCSTLLYDINMCLLSLNFVLLQGFIKPILYIHPPHELNKSIDKMVD